MPGSSIRHVSGYSMMEVIATFVLLLIATVLPAAVFQTIGRPEPPDSADALAKDVESMRRGLQLYIEEHGTYPCFDHAWDDTHEAAVLSPYAPWGKNPWGREYQLEHGAASGRFSISINIPSGEERQHIDTVLDDGNLSTGLYVASIDTTALYRLEYVGIPQPAVAVVPCPQSIVDSGPSR